MNPETIFITRYVASHDTCLSWYESVLGRPADDQPMPSCREWRLREGVLFQLIEDAGQAGQTSIAFGVADLDVEVSRVREAGIDISDPVPVGGFDTLRFTELCDPEDVTVGLLDE
ncbi:MAG: VOC family protein [Actinomycetia bacterium]|nr:VOC family protein [Actinomycetes bacterium]